MNGHLKGFGLPCLPIVYTAVALFGQRKRLQNVGKILNEWTNSRCPVDTVLYNGTTLFRSHSFGGSLKLRERERD